MVAILSWPQCVNLAYFAHHFQHRKRFKGKGQKGNKSSDDKRSGDNGLTLTQMVSKQCAEQEEQEQVG